LRLSGCATLTHYGLREPRARGNLEHSERCSFNPKNFWDYRGEVIVTRQIQRPSTTGPNTIHHALEVHLNVTTLELPAPRAAPTSRNGFTLSEGNAISSPSDDLPGYVSLCIHAFPALLEMQQKQ
jgi:hypothetical protein